MCQDTQIVVLNYAEGVSGTLSVHGLALKVCSGWTWHWLLPPGVPCQA